MSIYVIALSNAKSDAYIAFGPINEEIAVSVPSHMLLIQDEHVSFENRLIEMYPAPFGFRMVSAANAWDVRNQVDMPESPLLYAVKDYTANKMPLAMKGVAVNFYNIRQCPELSDDTMPTNLVVEQCKETGVLIPDDQDSTEHYGLLYKRLKRRKGFVALDPFWNSGRPRQIIYDLKQWAKLKEENKVKRITKKSKPDYLPRGLATYNELSDIRIAIHLTLVRTFERVVGYPHKRKKPVPVHFLVDAFHRRIDATVSAIKDLIKMGRHIDGKEVFDKRVKHAVKSAGLVRWVYGRHIKTYSARSAKRRHKERGVKEPKKGRDAKLVWNLIYGNPI